MKKKFILTLVFSAMLVFAGIGAYWLFFAAEKKSPVPATCEEIFFDFQTSLKRLAVNEYRGLCASSTDGVIAANMIWQEYSLLQKNESCAQFKTVNRVDKKMAVITEDMRKADELAREKNGTSACAFALRTRETLADLKKESGAVGMDAELFQLFIEIDKLEGSQGKEETMAVLPELKYKFTQLKQFQTGVEYQAVLAAMEIRIGDLDRMFYGPDFQKSQNELIAFFWQLYYEQYKKNNESM